MCIRFTSRISYGKNDNRVCKLLKSLYGLKQAPQKWNEKLNDSLVSFGFKHNLSDYSMFVKNIRNHVFIFISLC